MICDEAGGCRQKTGNFRRVCPINRATANFAYDSVGMNCVISRVACAAGDPVFTWGSKKRPTQCAPKVLGNF